MACDGIHTMNMDDFLSQPADGILYDLNRDEATTKTLVKDGTIGMRWINDLAVAYVIKALKCELDKYKKNMDNKTTQIKDEVENVMSRHLDYMARFCAAVESERTDAIIEYSEKNLFDSLLVMNHVWQTVAIHSGQFATPQEAEVKMSKFREAIIECFGIDPAELARKMFNKDTESNGTETETNCAKD